MDFMTELQGLGTQIIELAKTGIDLTAEYVPIVAREALMYWTVMAFVLPLIQILFITALVIVAVKLYRVSVRISNYVHSEDTDVLRYNALRKLYMADANEWAMSGSITFGVIAACWTVVVLLVGIPPIVKALVAPNMFFLEKAVELFK